LDEAGRNLRQKKGIKVQFETLRDKKRCCWGYIAVQTLENFSNLLPELNNKGRANFRNFRRGQRCKFFLQIKHFGGKNLAPTGFEPVSYG
jgi:hypothetical protein